MTGEIELYLGDCLEILPTLEDNSVDAIITDIPYGTTACKWDEVIPFDDMWREVKRVTGVFITTASQPFTSRLVVSNLDWFKYCLVWEKTNSGDFMLAKLRPRMRHEDICIFGTTAYNPQMETGKPYKDKPRKRTHNVIKSSIPKLGIDNKGWRYPSSIQKFSNGNNGAVHPTQKPVELYEYLIRTYTNEGDTVADITMGSGTTGVACVQTGRNFIGIEIEPKYYEIAEKRIQEAQQQIRMDI